MENSFQHQIFSFFQNEQNYKKVYEACLYRFQDPVLAKDGIQELFMKLAESREGAIKFPVDRKEAINYFKTAAIRQCYQILKEKNGIVSKSKSTKSTKEENEFRRENSTITKRIRQLDALIQQQKGKFTEDQLLLWKCLVEKRTVEEMTVILGKKEKTIYSLKNKLIAKIRKIFSFKDLKD